MNPKVEIEFEPSEVMRLDVKPILLHGTATIYVVIGEIGKPKRVSVITVGSLGLPGREFHIGFGYGDHEGER